MLKYKRKNKGELELFKSIYEKLDGICQITGQWIPFNVWNFAHCLSKGAYGKFRLLEDNIIHCHPDVHFLYDTSSKEKLLEKYPNASMFFEKKEELRYRYYNE